MEESSNLQPCPDCQHQCSTQAETCPACGRYFRAYLRTVKTMPGGGWSLTIFWGIMLVWILSALLIGGILVILFILGVLGAASLVKP